MDIAKIDNCTYCGEKFNGFRIAISMNLDVFRETPAGVVEAIDNMKFNTAEVLCSSCHDKFTNKINEFMEDKVV